MKRTPRTAGIEPAVRAAATYLAVINNALGPGPVALMAVLAGSRRNLAGDMCQEGLDVAPALDVEPLLDAALDGLALGGLVGQALAQHAVDADAVAVGSLDDLGAGRGRGVALWWLRLLGRLLDRLGGMLDLPELLLQQLSGEVELLRLNVLGLLLWSRLGGNMCRLQLSLLKLRGLVRSGSVQGWRGRKGRGRR